MNNSIPVSIVPTAVSPSPQISHSGPTTTNFTVSSIIESTSSPVVQASTDNTQTPSDSIATSKVNSIVGIVVALSIGFCVLFVGVVYICCRTRRKRRERRNDTIKTYGQYFTNSDNINSDADADKIPLELPEPTRAITRPTRGNQTNSTATSSTVSRYSAIINQLGPLIKNVIPENNRLTKSKRYGYF